MTGVVGYAQVPAGEQGWRAVDASLRAAGADRVFIDHAEERAPASRPGWESCLATLERGDVLLVHRVDRIDGAAAGVIQVFTDPGARGANLERDPVGDRVRYAELPRPEHGGAPRPVPLRRAPGRLRDRIDDPSR
ncbi:MAG: resolvase [Actinotalea sp.]|nr:resolvase [Actinotalea sp.]